MSHHMTSMVFQCFYAGGNTRLIALALADACADDSGAGIFLAIDTVAQMADVNRSTVQRTMARLLADNWLQREGGNVGGRGRTNTYNINPQWITAVAMERAEARQMGRRAGKVVPVLAELAAVSPEGAGQTTGPVDNSVKGGNLPPFTKPKRVAFGALKGGKNGLKGGIAVPPEQEQNTLTPPYPPNRGGACDFSEFQNLEAEYPRQDPADRPKAFRIWKKLAPDAQRVEAMRTVLSALKAGEQWRNDAGRYVPRLSRWLAGWLVGDGPPMPVQVAPVVPKPKPPPLSPEEAARVAQAAKVARAKLAAMRPPRVGSAKAVA
jgi:hypothetical protein